MNTIVIAREHFYNCSTIDLRMHGFLFSCGCIVIRRAQSFSGKSSMNVRRSISPIGGSRLSVTSQGSSYTINARVSNSDEELASPPPIPPRVIRPFSGGFDSTDAKEDPDYSYIRDDEVEGKPADTSTPASRSSTSVDRQLDDLLFDIMKDNERKKQKDKRIQPYAERLSPTKPRTLGPMVPNDFLVKTREYFEGLEEQQPSDYLDPIPTKKAATIAVSHTHSLSLPASMSSEVDPQLPHPSSSRDFQPLKKPLTNKSSNPYSTIPDKPTRSLTINTEMYQSQLPPELPPRVTRRSQSSSDDPSSPPLPPRSNRLSVDSDRPLLSPTKILRPKSYTDSHNSDISPYATTRNFQIDIGRQKSPGASSGGVSPRATSPPPLPPRSPIKRTRERTGSSSSSSSMSVHRCPKCNGRKSSTKQPVSKTMSLNDHRQYHHHHHHHHRPHPTYTSPGLDRNQVEASGSLPDLHKTSPIPENGLSQREEKHDDSGSSSQSSIETGGGAGHASSQSIPSPQLSQPQDNMVGRHLQQVQPTSPSSPPPYLQVMEENRSPPFTSGATPKVRSELDSALDVLSACVKDLETLESRVTNHNGTTRGKVATDLDLAIRQAKTVQSDLLLAMQDPKKPSEKPISREDRLHRSATVSHREYYMHSNGTQASKMRTMTLPHSPSSSPQLHKRSSAFGFNAPPIPPRSVVSLTSTQEKPTSPNHSLQHTDSTGSMYGTKKPCSPNHSIHHIESTAALCGNKKPVYRHSSHFFPRSDASTGNEGSTVFVHHIKDVRNSQF